MSDGKVVTLITGHCWNSKRRAGFHWLADSFWRHQWKVNFVTAWLSPIEWIKRDYRLEYIRKLGANKPFAEKERLTSFIAYQLLRPPSRLGKLGDWLTYPLFSHLSSRMLRKLEVVIKDADLIIFESGTGLMLFEACKKMNESARMVYRVSDDIRLFRSHSVVLDAEMRIAPLFDMISSPTEAIHSRFASLPSARLHRHGIPLHLYERPCTSPYRQDGQKNAVFAGTNSLDIDFLIRASGLFPEVDFHIIGPISGVPDAANIKRYGEMEYESVVPYIKWADIALNPRTLPTLADSNKVIQYEYCRLPIVMSDIDKCDRPHVFGYQRGDSDSIATAIRGALAFDRNQIRCDATRSWDHVVEELWGGSLVV